MVVNGSHVYLLWHRGAQLERPEHPTVLSAAPRAYTVAWIVRAVGVSFCLRIDASVCVCLSCIIYIRVRHVFFLAPCVKRALAALWRQISHSPMFVAWCLFCCIEGKSVCCSLNLNSNISVPLRLLPNVHSCSNARTSGQDSRERRRQASAGRVAQLSAVGPSASIY